MDAWAIRVVIHRGVSSGHHPTVSAITQRGIYFLAQLSCPHTHTRFVKKKKKKTLDLADEHECSPSRKGLLRVKEPPPALPHLLPVLCKITAQRHPLFIPHNHCIPVDGGKKTDPLPVSQTAVFLPPLHFHSVKKKKKKTSSRYLALRLKSIAVSPGRYRWQCCCAAAESSEHLEGWIQLQLMIPSPAPGQAMDPPRASPTLAEWNQVFAVSVHFVRPPVGPVLARLRCRAPTARILILQTRYGLGALRGRGGGGTGVSGRLQIKSFFFFFFFFFGQVAFRGEGLRSKAADRFFFIFFF